MDASEGASLGIGNSMMDEMKGENEERKRHNMDVDSQIQAQRSAVLQRVSGEKSGAKQEEAVGGSLAGTETIARAYGVVKAGRKAAQTAEAAGEGWSSMGLGEQASRTLGQYAKDSEILKTGKALATPVAAAGRSVAGSAGEVAQGYRGAVATGQSAVRAAGGAAASLGGKIATSAGESVAGGVKSAMSGLAKSTAEALPDEEAVSSVTKGFTTLEKGAKGLGILTGGYDLIDDLASGKVVGHNANERTSNELGIASGAAEAVSFLIPGFGLIGAAIGLASGIEGASGASKEKKDTGPTGALAQKQQAEQETGGKVASTPQVAEQQTGASQQVQIGGTSAF